MSAEDHMVESLWHVDVPLAQRVRAIRTVASASSDAAECGMLLDMLGLRPRQDVSAPRPGRTAHDSSTAEQGNNIGQ